MLDKPINSVVLSHRLPHVFGNDAWTWHPQTMEEELERTFGFVDEINIQKVHALQVLFASDAPKNDWLAFEKVIHGLIGNETLFRTMQRPTPQQLFLGVDIILSIDPDFLREIEDEVISYIAAVFADAELPWVPPPFSERPEIQERVIELTDTDPTPFEQDYHGPKREPASKMILQCYNVVTSDREARQQELS